MPNIYPHHRGDGEKGARKGPRPSQHLPRLYYDYEDYGYEAVVLA